MESLYLVFAGLGVFLVIFAVLFNKLRVANISVNEALAQIDVQLKRRADLIPNLVETVKGYASHESGTLTKVTEARSATMKATTFDDKVSSDNMLTGALRGLLAISENYPDLKASANFLALQEELSTTENKIAFARQYYNDSVLVANSLVTTIPTNMFAGVAGVKLREFYTVENEADRKLPDVKF
jgi:LemA protein